LLLLSPLLLFYAEPVYAEHVEGKHCCNKLSSFSIIHLVSVVPPFALMQKVEPKIKASTNLSARLATHAQQQSLLHSSFTCFVPRILFHCCLQLFQNLMAFLWV
jgi:hypothetical protein